jgi:hypothetical protein
MRVICYKFIMQIFLFRSWKTLQDGYCCYELGGVVQGTQFSRCTNYYVSALLFC